MKIDAHQHFWALERGDYFWLSADLTAIYRDFLPKDLTPILDELGIEGTVLVQAAPSVAETEFLLKLADAHSFIQGVVGWVDFESPDAPDIIHRLSSHAAFVGLRPMIEDIADDAWMLDDKLAPTFAALLDCDLSFDALTLPRHLPNLAILMRRYETMRVVIDHGSKPAIAKGEFKLWATDIAALARETDAFCKMSGLVTEAGHGVSADILRPYVEHLFDTFGPQRLIWGSDWPVCTLATSYRQWWEMSEDLLSPLTADARAAILGGNATRAYRLRDQHAAGNC